MKTTHTSAQTHTCITMGQIYTRCSIELMTHDDDDLIRVTAVQVLLENGTSLTEYLTQVRYPGSTRGYIICDG